MCSGQHHSTRTDKGRSNKYYHAVDDRSHSGEEDRQGVDSIVLMWGRWREASFEIEMKSGVVKFVVRLKW